MHKMIKRGSLALIGVGNWGRHLARNFYQLGALHTLCDSDVSKLHSFKMYYPDVHLNADYQALLKNPEITQIAVAAPSIHHYKLTKQALLAGKDVYVEKPLALSFCECEELYQISVKSKLVLMTGHILHYHPSIVCLKKMVLQGEIGNVEKISSYRMNAGNCKCDEGVLWDLGPHDVSVILSLVAHPLKSINCLNETDALHGRIETATLNLHFANHVQATIHLSHVHAIKEQKICVLGSSGTLIFDDIKAWNEKLTFSQTSFNISQNSVNPRRMVVEHPVFEPLREECSHFISCCEERLKPDTDGKEATHVIKVLEYAQRSLEQNGRKINFD